MTEHVEHVSGLIRRQSLHATVIRACKKCGAPGHWHDNPNLAKACYDPAKKRAADAAGLGVAPVGPVCPQCGNHREDDEHLGEIWSKVWRVPTFWEQIKAAFMNRRSV